jgi:hypothetical protein
MNESKVTAAHLRRTAVIYVRQSSLAQVDRNKESTARQYDLVARAQALGWPRVMRTGRGGFGVVYWCLQQSRDRTVAVKVLTADLDEDNLERFIREQRAMGRLSGHPRVTILDSLNDLDLVVSP